MSRVSAHHLCGQLLCCRGEGLGVVLSVSVIECLSTDHTPPGPLSLSSLLSAVTTSALTQSSHSCELDVGRAGVWSRLSHVSVLNEM